MKDGLAGEFQAATPAAPTREVGRAVFHVIAVNSAMFYYYFTDTVGAWVLFGLGVVAVALDFGRTRLPAVRKRLPGFVLRMVRGREQTRISAITHFVLAATLIDFVYLTVGLPKDAVLAAVMFVSVGDPLARIVGMSVRSPRIYGTKTLAGTSTFFVAGVLAAGIVSALFGAQITWFQLFAGGAVLTGIELVSGPYDNFTLPFFGSLVMIALGAVA